MSVVSIKQLLEAGVHFGHRTQRWNPKMKPYIFGERNGIHIIDLRQSLDKTNEAYEFVKKEVANGGKVMFVGTKKQVAGAIAEAADRSDMPYVNFRWLGGMLTNFSTIQKRIFYMRELARMEETGETQGRVKKERLKMSRELEKLRRNLGGVADLKSIPSVLFVIDINVEATAVKEANRLGIPVIAVVDSNCDPDNVDIVIPGNDDAVRSAQLLAGVIAQAAIDGRQAVGADDVKEMTEAAEAAEAAVTESAESAPVEAAPVEAAPVEAAPAEAAPAPTEPATTDVATDTK